MRYAVSCLFATSFVAQALFNPLFGETNKQETYITTTPSYDSQTQSSTVSSQESPKPTKPFTAFTGRTLKSKVRIRLQPSLDAPILREITKGDLFVVVGEADDFYAIEAPIDIKGYVFRTFVLDNVIEGNRVNVRLEPNLEAPVIAQMNAGDKIDGIVSALNSKWFEITPPHSTRFYIAKEYVEKMGNSGLKATLDKKREEGSLLLNNTFADSQAELRKPWNEINLEGINDNLNKIIKDYSEFSDIHSKAKELLTMVQESYFQKKIDYLEKLSKNTDLLNAHNKELSSKVALQEQRINELVQNTQSIPEGDANSAFTPPASYDHYIANPADKMNSWLSVENKLYENWAEYHENQPISVFYDEQSQNSVTLKKGIIQQYNRTVRNKPGDFVLLNPTTRIPEAYLYSTQINLQDYVGKEVTVKASPRANNNFAYPAYFVISIE